MDASAKANFICKICDISFPDQRRFSSHLRWTHEGVAHYYETYEPKSCTLCGAPIKFKQYYTTRYFAAKLCSKSCCGKGPAGIQHYNWRGGRIVGSEGYILRKLASIPQEDRELVKPMLRKSKYVSEHRYVMAKKLGRALLKTEVVHHINGIKNDNTPENLELWIEHHPRGTRGSDIQCPCCGYTFNREAHGRRDVRKAS